MKCRSDRKNSKSYQIISQNFQLVQFYCSSALLPQLLSLINISSCSFLPFSLDYILCVPYPHDSTYPCIPCRCRCCSQRTAISYFQSILCGAYRRPHCCHLLICVILFRLFVVYDRLQLASRMTRLLQKTCVKLHLML